MAIIYNTAPCAKEVAASNTSKNSIQCEIYQCNISSSAATVNTMIDHVVFHIVGLDIMAANAGVAYAFRAEDCTPDRLLQTRCSLILMEAFGAPEKLLRPGRKVGHLLI